MIPVVCVYTGFAVILVGVVSLVKPLRWVGIRKRSRGLLVTVGGFCLTAAGMNLPAPELRVAAAQNQLDQFIPVYQFHEFHSMRVAAPKERVYRAIKEVRVDEIRLFRTLTWIRRMGRPGPESVLNAPERQPLLEVVTHTGFLLLAEEPNQEIVVGTLVAVPPGWRPKPNPTPEDFRAVRVPGFALAVMNFHLEDDGVGGTLLTTETRVYATDAGTRRRFARYWRVIYPGSALIRRMWLRAVQRRAEAPAG
ncbi:MAG: hypothetical protein LAN63_10125 [Acidobacteriia bacterium]|nr:hypothetical protein [Terriglobia bacterium]